MTYCERINDPQYRINLEQLTKILGDSNAATAALESNNGFSLDKAPNGKDSFLYQSLYDTISEKYPDLSEEEKIEKVTKLKLQTYSPEFKEWFGDWERKAINFLGESTGIIDIADIINEDGSINFKVLEEITDEYFNNADETLFNKGRKTLRQRPEKHYDGEGNLIENNTLDHLQNVTKSALASNIRSDLKPQLVLAAALHDLAKPFHGGQIHGFQSLDLVNKLFKGNISPLVKFAIKHHMLTTEENKKFSIDDATRIMQEALDNNLNLDDAIEILLAINTADILSGQSEDSIDYYSKKSKKDTINEEIPFKKSLLLQAKNKLNNVSKVVDDNGEPLVVYHNSSAKFDTFDISLAKTPGDIYFTQSKFISDSNRYGENAYPVFLSIKDLYDTRTADFSHIENSDGAFDPHHQGTYIVHNPNQIKSVENNGQYSPTDNNIYHEHFSDRVFNRTSTRDSKLTDYFTGENSTARSLEIPLKEFIEKLQDNPQYRGLYQLLHEKHLTTRKHSLIKETKIILDFPFLSTAEQQRSQFEGRRAYYDSKSHEIHINVESNFIDGNADSVIWHEIMHAMTVNRLQDPKAREKFQTILNDYLKVHYNPIYTGENGLEEFVADIWSDVSLVFELKQIPSKRTGFASIWDSIKSWLIEAFGLIEDNSLFAEASAELDRMFDEQEQFVKESKFFEHINSLNQDTKDILSLIKYQYQIQYENPTEFKVNFENVIKGYLSGESWAIDLVKSLVDKVQIRQTQLHVLGYDYNEESYDENGVFEWEKYLGGIDLNKEIEELSEEDKLKFTPIENYQVSLAEIIMPKLYKTQFHLGNHSIAEIDKDFFKKTNSFYYSDLKTFSKEGLLESKAKIDFLVRCHNYKFNIVVSDSLSTPPAKNLKPIEVEVVNGYRRKNGERMYALPDRSEYQIYKDSKGNETIVFKNSESVESSIKDLINSLDDKDLVSVQTFLENLEPTKDWLRYVMNINHIKTGNSSLKKLINENLTSDEIRKELLEIYYENSDIYKDQYGRRPNKYKEELAETLYNSFLKTLEVISVRIPTQAFQSIMAAKVVGFTNDDFNNVFVTRWQFWLQGSDLDIKKY